MWSQGNVIGTFLNVSGLVSCCNSEQGLLGLAFHPRYEDNGFFYIHYTDRGGNTVVARYRVSVSNQNVADPGSRVPVMTVPQPQANHNGGHLAFGPDGYLYIGRGDGGGAGDANNNAQNLGSLLGKMLRIDVDGTQPYSVPPDNPFVGRPGIRPEIWDYGLRNPWRYSFDRASGTLFIADVGQGAREEVNVEPPDAGGKNYGWRRMEGSLCFNPSTGCNDGTLTLPQIEYTHSEGCSVTGGYQYRGSAIPGLFARYVYGDFCQGTIWGATEQGGGAWSTAVLLDTALRISSFGEDEQGELYVVHIGTSASSFTDGAVYRIVAPPASGERVLDNLPVGQQDAARTVTGTWCVSASGGFFGVNSLYSCGGGLDTYRWTPTLAAGVYDVFVWWTQHANRSTSVPISVVHAGGTTTRTFNEQTGGGQWVLHGRYTFNAGTNGSVGVSDVNGQAAADAVRFVPATPSESALDNLPVGQQDAARTVTGTWCVSASGGFFGVNSLYSCGGGLDTYRWTPTLAAGVYDVFVWWTQHANRSTSVPISVVHAGGTTTRTFNEQTGGGQWVLHGRYTFNAGTSGSVRVSDVNGQAAADAVRFVPAP